MTARFLETIGFKHALCTGCRACETACSFKMNRSFSSHGTAIEILRDNLTGDIDFRIKPTCDVCKNRLEPACIEACPTGALVLKRAKLVM
jgi:Fe-S-cluster-containing dehydrogenase component